jgi:hypothetical protein
MTFLQRLVGELCSHRFAWPRLTGNGQHYQICLVCGTAYEYDWTMIHRTDRLLVANEQHALASARTRLPRAVDFRSVVTAATDFTSTPNGSLPQYGEATSSIL